MTDQDIYKQTQVLAGKIAEVEHFELTDDELSVFARRSESPLGRKYFEMAVVAQELLSNYDMSTIINKCEPR